MAMVKNIRSIIAIAILFLLMGCELYLVPPRGREKPGDEDAQITGFRALQLGEDSVTAEFAWKPSRDYYDEYGRVDEVKLFMQKDKPYLFPVHFFDGDTLEGRSFDRQLGVYDYSAEWSGFSSGDEAWVTLYYRTEDGWRAPLYDRVKVESTVPSAILDSTNYQATEVMTVYYDYSTGDHSTDWPSTDYNVSYDSAVDTEQIAIIRFENLDNYLYSSQATIEFSSNSTTDGAIIYPVYQLNADYYDLNNYVDFNSVAISFGNPTIAEISTV